MIKLLLISFLILVVVSQCKGYGDYKEKVAVASQQTVAYDIAHWAEYGIDLAGSHVVPYSDSACGTAGYQFKEYKKRHDGFAAKLHKSDCWVLPSGKLVGYVYPKTNKSLRIWFESSNGRTEPYNFNG